MSCREEVLEMVRELDTRTPGVEFSASDIIRLMKEKQSKYKEGSIRVYIVSRMCINSPVVRGKNYPDLWRVSPTTYRLASCTEFAGLSEVKQKIAM